MTTEKKWYMNYFYDSLDDDDAIQFREFQLPATPNKI